MSSPFVRRLRLGAELRALRQRRGLTTEQLGGLFHQSRMKISRLENAQVRPDLVDVGRRIALEADSFAWHGSRAALAADCRRDNALVVSGFVVLRFSWEQVVGEPTRGAETVREAVDLVDLAKDKLGMSSATETVADTVEDAAGSVDSAGESVAGATGDVAGSVVDGVGDVTT